MALRPSTFEARNSNHPRNPRGVSIRAVITRRSACHVDSESANCDLGNVPEKLDSVIFHCTWPQSPPMRPRKSAAASHSSLPRKRIPRTERFPVADVSLRKNRTWQISSALLILVIVFGAITAIFEFFREVKREPTVPPDPAERQPPSWSKLRVFRRGAVCVDSRECALIGRSMLERNGSAVDAAIAAMICNGLFNMQSMGFGGGFMMTIYQRANREAVVLDARECAPRAAREDTYNGLPSLSSQTGPLAIAVPGELTGYWKAHQRFGRLPWADLFESSIEICEAGYTLSKNQRDSLLMNKQAAHADPSLRSWFVDEKTGDFHNPGTIVRPVKLCETMRLLASSGAAEFYNGELGRLFVQDLRRRGSILSLDDLTSYRAKWSRPVSIRLSTGEKLHTVGPPGSGPVLAFILNVLDGFGLGTSSFATPEATLITYHRIIEAFKYGYALRTKLADPAYVDISALLRNMTSRNFADEVRSRIDDHQTRNGPEHYGASDPGGIGDHGTAHVSILAPNGDAVSVTSSVNLHFGTGMVSEMTGILTSSSMDDFGLPHRTNYQQLPASRNNYIEPGKRPISSMTPSIILDPNDDVRIVIGAAGGTRITTAVAYVIARHLWVNESVKEAIDAARIHHQLLPMRVSYEYGVPKPVIDGLRLIGHETLRYRDRGSVVCAIARVNGTVHANADYRKGGDVYGID